MSEYENAMAKIRRAASWYTPVEEHCRTITVSHWCQGRRFKVERRWLHVAGCRHFGAS